MTRAVTRVLVALVLVLPLAGCGAAGGEPRTPSRDRMAGAEPAATASAADPGPCPRLRRAQPREDGLPDLELPCLGDGPPVNLADLRGTPTVLNVWAAWCTNCDREMPLFADAVARADDRVRFFGVHYKAAREFGLRSVEDFGVPFPSVHDEDGDLVVTRLGAYAPPQTFFVTADGRIAGREIGEITSQQRLDDLVHRYLGVRL